jgi:DNA (cytosine-5)-methyltransferase 1
MRTVTAKHRLGLVTIEGSDYQIVDIGMRMLEPDELLAAQFGRFAGSYDLAAARTKAAKVRLIGNSVCPEVAEAVVRANVTTHVTSREVA